MLRKTILGLFVILTLLMSITVQAAEFPTKEVQIIIPWAAGGATDLVFRALAAATEKNSAIFEIFADPLTKYVPSFLIIISFSLSIKE